MFAYAYSCVFRRKGNRSVPPRQLYSRRKIVSTYARARDATRSHTSEHAARDIREKRRQWGPDYKIWNDFVGVLRCRGDLRNSPDCCGSERELRGCDASERYAPRLAIARDLGKVCVHTGACGNCCSVRMNPGWSVVSTSEYSSARYSNLRMQSANEPGIRVPRCATRNGGARIIPNWKSRAILE